jgi:hypothetical protein
MQFASFLEVVIMVTMPSQSIHASLDGISLYHIISLAQVGSKFHLRLKRPQIWSLFSVNHPLTIWL